MNSSLRTIRLLAPFILLVSLVSCFKAKFPVVSSPDDITGDTITTAPDIQQLHRKVLIIGIGGCRGDAMRIANAPNIHGLLPHAIYSFDALTQTPTGDGPGWASLLTGVWSDKHGVKDNSFSGSNFTEFPMIYKYLKIFNPQLRTVSICSWDPLNDKLVSNTDVKINANQHDIAVKDSAIAHLKNGNPDVMFLDLEGVTQAGVQYGFDTTVPQYMQAITKVDGYVGEILAALKSRPGISGENWLIVLSSNHGGVLSGYGGNSYPEQNIFTIFYNKNFNSKELVPSGFSLKCPHFQDASQFAFLKETTDPSFLDFDRYGGFTIQLKVKSGPQTGADAFLTNKNWNSGANPGWVMTVQGQGWAFNAGDGGGKRVDVTAAAPPLSDNRWHSIAITVNKANNIVELFQDDTLRNSASVAGLSTWNSGSDVKLNSGDDITGMLSKKWGNSVFTVANIRIWDTVINKSDFAKYASLCDTLISPDNPYKNNLVGWWKCMDGQGDILKDYGPYKFNMQLAGPPQWITQETNLCNDPIPPSVPTIVDVAPAILNWLNVPIDAGWRMDGSSWIQGTDIR